MSDTAFVSREIRPTRALMRPLPELPQADCVSDDPEGRLGLAVALDVLATQTRLIPSSPAILELLSQALWKLRDPSAAEEDASSLLRTARGPVGFARSRLNQGLSLALSPVSLPPTTQTQRSSAQIPEVHHTLSLIDQAATLIIAKETLNIRVNQKGYTPKA